MEAFQQLYMLSAQHPGFHSIQKSADDNCHVTLTLIIKRSGWLCHILCWRWPKELLALARRWSRSLVIMASLEITLLRYVGGRWWWSGVGYTPRVGNFGEARPLSSSGWWSDRMLEQPLRSGQPLFEECPLCVQFKDQLLGRLFFGRGGDGD